ncbi:MAG: hypothetical protein R2713_12100 [Ilumatobacteraceae bacterium]
MPAQGCRTVRVRFPSARCRGRSCTGAQQSGLFEGELGQAYYCVLPNGVVIFCNYQTSQCVVLKTVPPTKPSPAPAPWHSNRGGAHLWGG